MSLTPVVDVCSACVRAGYYNGDQSSPYQTFTEQWQHYRQAYDVAALSLQQGRGLKGIMFWHWAGVDNNAPNGEGSTICAPFAANFSEPR